MEGMLIITVLTFLRIIVPLFILLGFGELILRHAKSTHEPLRVE